MTSTVQRMVDAQSERLRALDPLLPLWATPPEGMVLTAGAGDDQVAGVVLRFSHPPGSIARTWSAAMVSELVPVLGSSGAAGMHALLDVWRERLPLLDLPDSDSACVVNWPSQDVEVGSALLDHGLVPLCVIGVRPAVARRRGMSARASSAGTSGHAPDPPTGLLVRRAGPDDLADCLRLALLEQSYSAMVGGAVLREDADELKRSLLIARLSGQDPVWLAERAGVTVGMLECGYTDATAGTWAATRLPPGRWGYINCASVLPGARGHGVGRALADRAHSEFAAAATAGSYLYYNPPNPLSSVFWHRQGYRPLWTLWEARPATALR